MKIHGGTLNTTSERSHSKGLYDSIYMKLWKRQNFGDSTKVSGCQGLGSKREGLIGGALGIFRAVKLVCVIL